LERILQRVEQRNHNSLFLTDLLGDSDVVFIFSTDQSEQDLMRAQLEQQPTGIRMRKTVLQHDDAKEALTMDSTTGK
jgi:long-subunit acyl-CoA synthetase (AMP-forming)